MEEEKEWQESEMDSGDHESFEKAALVGRGSGVSAHGPTVCACEGPGLL